MRVSLIDDYYKQNPQRAGHIDILFEPIFAKKYIHFDTCFFYNNNLVQIDRGGSGWGQNGECSLDRIDAVKYILSDDKKIFRKEPHYFQDKTIKREDYHNKYDYFGSLFNFQTVRLSCNESEIKLSGENLCLYVNRVSVCCPPYLCPTTGILWEYKNQDDRGLVFSDKFWLFKRLPNARVVMRESISGREALFVKRDLEIHTLKDETSAYDPTIFFSKNKTAFLSDINMILKRLDISPWRKSEYGLKDSRQFLLKQPKPPKFAVIKSAARYLKKRLKISPLRPSEKKFFQMMGALAHINNETLGRKKAYAA